MTFALRPVRLPDFEVPHARPEIPAETYAARADAAYAGAGRDWLVVYADREHLANMAFLTGFEPRFEEALLILGKRGRRVLVVGNESGSYAVLAGLPDLEVVLCQSLSLLGQPREAAPNLEDVLGEIGIRQGDTIGLVGWKYLAPDEWRGPLPSFQVSAFIVDTLRAAAGDPAAVTDATSVLMHPETGLRAVVDVHEIAALEWGAARASAAVWRIVQGAREGDDEFSAASRMNYAGEPLSCHVMFASASPGNPVIGLRSPVGRKLAKGDGVTTAVGYWGGLSCRAGLFTDHDAVFLETAKAYFRGLAEWYDIADIGVEGGQIFAAVTEALNEHGLDQALNPGHLVGHDEWVHTPVRPGSTEKLRSGMPFQVDIIPVPMKDNWALNHEDSVTFADGALRNELARLYPAVHARVEARRAFIRDVIGIELKPSILPMSHAPLALPPFWLASDKILVRQ
jgi:Xaa-Pro aminopeptidase